MKNQQVTSETVIIGFLTVCWKIENINKPNKLDPYLSTKDYRSEPHVPHKNVKNKTKGIDGLVREGCDNVEDYTQK